jgi:hypothetical protein
VTESAARTESAPDPAQMHAGALVFAIAGSLWGLYGGYSLRHAAGFWPLAVVVLAGAGVFAAWSSLRGRLAGRSGSESARDAGEGRAFTLVNIAQGIAIFVALQVCTNLHAAEYFPVAFSAIVGLHFVALAPVFRSGFHAVLGGLMCLFAVWVTLALPKFVPAAAAGGSATFAWGCALGLGNAALLWGAAGLRLRAIRACLAAGN